VQAAMREKRAMELENTAKRMLLKLLLAPGIAAPFSVLMRGRVVIFMLHRFRDPEIGSKGQDPQVTRRGLAYLRKKKYSLLSLEGVFRRMANGRSPRPAVAFTIDDGYLDHATVGARVFAEYDCPVTTFLTTGFLDHGAFFWWDQIDFVFARTARKEITVCLGDSEQRFAWGDAAGRRRAQSGFTEHCKGVHKDERTAAIARLSEAAGVELPDKPPPCYAPMSWDQARSCEKGGMTFGPHTVTHPFLSQVSDQQSAQEIGNSWQRVRSELRQPVPVFCYPYGRRGDFGAREVGILQGLGFLGAVVGEPGYGDRATFRKSPAAPFEVRRFGYPNSLTDLAQIVSGIERFKQMVRRET
jgi:peptidoglycan/xylan/chitin deacetylase (PgdA/CDA1 family)